MTAETGKHAPHSSTKLPDTNKKSDVRKQWTRLEKIIWPVAPDGYIPNSVVRSLAPYPKFSNPCASRGLQIKALLERDATLRLAKQKRQLKYFLEKYCPFKEEQNKEDDEISLEHAIESVPEEINTTASLTSLQNKSERKTKASLTRRAVPQSLLQNRQKFLQQNASSVVELQMSNDLQTTDSSDDLQMNDSSADDLQANAASVQELKNEEDGEKDQSLCEKSNAFPTEESKKGQKAGFKLLEGVSVSTSLQEEKEESHQEKMKSDSTNKNLHAEIGAPKQTMQKKTHSPLKKLKSFVPPLPLLGDRRPNSVLIYLYKRSKPESAHEGVKQAPKVA